ncbi:uncharacterized protein LOC134243555 [Saccostrea cucullata]|uniref:uncharacterized protein LOC134243555 n=1 Tax=Saccostrea cuccullata TaxID=36930 RepID=UPI002ED16A66
MLHSMIFKNFVHYHEYQSLEFNTGFNLIIGSNSSGKSVIFEIIRRCLSTKKSATITSTYGESKVSFAVCRYINVSAEYNTMLSGIYKQVGDSPKQTTYVKFVIFQSSEKQYICCANKFACKEMNILSEDTMMSSENVYVTEEKTPKIYNFLKDGIVPIEKDADAVEREIIVLYKECDFKSKKESECQCKLAMLDDRYVATFPMRSIGPSQWTESDRVDARLHRENEIITNERAEIIHFLFEKGMKGFDKHVFEETLWKLTHPKKNTNLA